MIPYTSASGLALPRDPISWIALGLGVLLLLALPALRWAKLPKNKWVWLCALGLLASLLSLGYVHYYLQDGPRIIDATSYYLEAKGFSKGLMAWEVPEPSASFRGRFLVTGDKGPLEHELGVLFPPGYPALLAVGFWLGTPMLVGPALAFALVLVTYALAKAATGREDIARLAALLSVINAALRYHTADTMSHGLAALLLSGAVLAALRALDTEKLKSRLLYVSLFGLCTGWLCVTRFASGLALGASIAVALVVLGTRQARLDLSKKSLVAGLGALALGALPAALLLLLHQHAVTGHWLQSTQLAYYAVSDGPPGCFRYGFGKGIGCLVEHGPFVRDNLPSGYTLGPALHVTGRRLYQAAADLSNYVYLSVPLLLGLGLGWGQKRVRFLGLLLALLVLAYAPFYFDGNYPGGGARMLADGLPAGHVLLAAGWVLTAERLWKKPLQIEKLYGLVLGLSLMGFALHIGHQHRVLKERDGGHPMYEPKIVQSVLGERPTGLLFVDTDHGFNLAYEPGVKDAFSGLVVAKPRRDDRDRLLWQRLGRPKAYRYAYHPWEKESGTPRVLPWEPEPSTPDEWVFESEAEWPALQQSGGYSAWVYLAPQSCVSGGMGLALVRTEGEEACLTVEVPIPEKGRFRIEPQVIVKTQEPIRAELSVPGLAKQHFIIPQMGYADWPGAKRSPLDGLLCVPISPLISAFESPGGARLTVCSKAEWTALDRVVVRRASLQDR